MSSFLIVCPFVHRPTFKDMILTLDPGLLKDALIIDNTKTNLGAAGSRNVGARRILEEGIDWMVDISPVTRFGPPGGWDFINQLDDHQDAWVVQSSAPVNWHLIAWSRRVYENVGFWDEQYGPIYGEDGDMSYRIHQHRRENPGDGQWDVVDVDAWVTMYGHSIKVGGVKVDMAQVWERYKAKWGGLSGQETFTRPYGDPSLPLSYCPG